MYHTRLFCQVYETTHTTSESIGQDAARAVSLDALLADCAGAAWVIRRLADTAALVHPDDAPHVRAWLLRHGHLLALMEVNGSGPS